MRYKLFFLSIIPLILSGCSTSENSETTKVYLWNDNETTTITATYNEPMPSVDVPTHPYEEDYIFQGYYERTNGKGKQYYKEDGTSSRNWDKKIKSSSLYAYYIKSDTSEYSYTQGSSSSSSNNTYTYSNTPYSYYVPPAEKKTYKDNKIDEVGKLTFITTQFGNGSGYFAASYALNNGYVAQTDITVKVNVDIYLTYHPASQAGGLIWLSYSETIICQINMTIPAGKTYASGSNSITWPMSVVKNVGNVSCTYNTSNPTYTKVYKITGTAIEA